MESGNEVIHYLEDLASELQALGVVSQFHLLISGGAYMLLQQSRRSTQDIDFALIVGPPLPEPGKELQVEVQRAEVSKKSSRVPDASKFRQAIEIIAQRAGLDTDWMNDESAVYLYDDAPQASVYFWRSFGVLHVYLPTKEYVFALKVAAFRAKDQDDIRMLVSDLGLQTRKEAQAILDRFLLPEAQEFWRVGRNLRRVFPS